MLVQPYLFFNGRAEEALEFYRKALGATDVQLVRFKESPDPQQAGMPAGAENKIMHMSFRVGETELMGSDGQCTGTTSFQGFSLSLTAKSEAEADRYFGALSEGGQVQLPLTKTFFSPKFGMLADRFGLGWMVYVKP